MAAPATITTLNFSGKYTQVGGPECCCSKFDVVDRLRLQNKDLSDSMDEILKLQGVSWAMRKAAGFASITVTITHTTEGGVEKMHLKQEGPNTTEELWVLDWTEKENDHKLFGKVAMKMRRAKLEEMQDGFHKDGLKGGAQEHGVVNVYTKGLKTSWTNNAVSYLAQRATGHCLLLM